MPAQTRLDGQQVALLCDTLTSAFDRGDLRAMVRIELDEELDVIAGGENLQDLALSLVDWAEDNGRVADLIAAMQRSNPTNPQVQALARSSTAWFNPSANPPTHPAAVRAAPTTQSPRPSPSRKRMIGALLLLGLLACAVVSAVFMRGNLSTLYPATADTGTAVHKQSAPAEIATGATADTAADTVADTAVDAAGSDSQGAIKLQVTTPDQDWRVGTRVYRLLSAAAIQLNSSQTQVSLQLRMTNNGDTDDMLTGADMHLIDGEVVYEPQDYFDTCYILVSGSAAEDECRVSFLINGAPPSLALRLQSGTAQSSVPVTLGGAVQDGTPPPPPAGRLSVQTPGGVWPVGARAYQVLNAAAEPYDATRTVIGLQIAMTNNGSADANFWARYMRLLEDGVPRAPQRDWSTTCSSIVGPGQTSDRCNIEFVVANSAADLKLRFFDEGPQAEVIVPLPVSHTEQ